MKTGGPRVPQTVVLTQRRQAVTKKGSRGSMAETASAGGLDKAREGTESETTA